MRHPLPALLPLLLLGAGTASAAEPPARAAVHTVHILEGARLNATVTLLPFDGKLGRTHEFYNGYRPQLRFATDPPHDVTCVLQLPKPLEKVAPGQTADVEALCIEPLTLPENQFAFGMYEGGRQVGHGVLNRR